MSSAKSKGKPDKQSTNQKVQFLWNQCQSCKAIIHKCHNEAHSEGDCHNLSSLIELNQPFLYQNFASLIPNEHVKGELAKKRIIYRNNFNIYIYILIESG